MSETERLALEYADAVSTHRLENLYGTSQSYTLGKAKERDEAWSALAAELRRLAAVEQELEALKRAISDAEPVYMVKQAISESTWTQVPRAEYEEAVYFGVVKRTLYTLKGIK